MTGDEEGASGALEGREEAEPPEAAAQGAAEAVATEVGEESCGVDFCETGGVEKGLELGGGKEVVVVGIVEECGVGVEGVGCEEHELSAGLEGAPPGVEGGGRVGEVFDEVLGDDAAERSIGEG